MTYDERIYNQAIADGMPPVLATLIVAQAKHETGDYTSHAFTSCLNCFGYKWVNQSTAAGPCIISSEGDAFAKYTSVEQSTHELTAWIRRRQRAGIFPADLSTIATAEAYATLLKNAGYYGDTLENYTNALIYWLSKLGSLPLAAQVGGGFLLLVLLSLGIVYRKKLFS